MYIVIGGGGKVGYYLARGLVNQGHEVLVIEKDRKKADLIAEELGSVVLAGDACEATTQNEAGVGRADVVVAATGDDEDNLVICQMAKKKFNVGRTIARVSNPKNRNIFKQLGIDATVSGTELIMSYIEQELPTNALVHLLKLRDPNLEVVEMTIGSKARVAGQQLKDVPFPPNSVVLLVVHDGQTVVPTGDTPLQPGDDVIALTRVENESALRRLLAEF